MKYLTLPDELVVIDWKPEVSPFEGIELMYNKYNEQ